MSGYNEHFITNDDVVPSCTGCGVLVGDPDQHDVWHRMQDALMAQRLADSASDGSSGAAAGRRPTPSGPASGTGETATLEKSPDVLPVASDERAWDTESTDAQQVHHPPAHSGRWEAEGQSVDVPRITGLDNYTVAALRKASQEREDAIRFKLIELGWTPPGDGPSVAAQKTLINNALWHLGQLNLSAITSPHGARAADILREVLTAWDSNTSDAT